MTGPRGDSPLQPVADAVRGNWVDRFAPDWAAPYLRLARADRPIGVWLLLWPCCWSAALAAGAAGEKLPNLWHLLLFAVGSLVMRAAGCAYNDIVDRDFDARVERTKSRPIPAGQISVRQAQIFMVSMSLIGFLVLIKFNWFTIFLGIASLLPIAIYPFMKRLTNWPQMVLGFVFGWGALMGWAAVFGRLDPAAWFLYGATMAWIVGYDTIYAHQDKEDDALLGLGSTALRFGETTRRWLLLFYGTTLAGLFAAGWLAGSGLPYFGGVALAAAHFAWQIATLDTTDPENCLARFRSNRDLGALIFAAMVLDIALVAGS